MLPDVWHVFHHLSDNADGFLLQEQRQKHRLRERPEDYARGLNCGFCVQIFYSVGCSFGFAFQQFLNPDMMMMLMLMMAITDTTAKLRRS